MLAGECKGLIPYYLALCSHLHLPKLGVKYYYFIIMLLIYTHLTQWKMITKNAVR